MAKLMRQMVTILMWQLAESRAVLFDRMAQLPAGEALQQETPQPDNIDTSGLQPDTNILAGWK